MSGRRLALVRPPPLEPGGAIGIFTPSLPANVRFRDKYRHGLEVLRRLGFRVVEGALTARGVAQGYRSGSPEERAAELMALFLDPSIDAVVATMGGAVSASMIPHLDFDRIRDNPKVLCGYSDITSLHLAILARAGLSTFYGPAVMTSFGEWPDVLPETRDSFLDAVQRHREGPRELVPPRRWSNHFREATTGAWREEPREMRDNPGWRAVRPGRASGPSLVANLDTLLTAAGTDTFPDLDGAVLFIEEMDAPLDREERSLRHLERLGVFDRISGLVVGKAEAPDRLGAPFGHDELLLEVVGDRGLPIATEFDCGHTHPMLTLAQAVPVSLEVGEGRAVRVVIEQPMVERRRGGP